MRCSQAWTGTSPASVDGNNTFRLVQRRKSSLNRDIARQGVRERRPAFEAGFYGITRTTQRHRFAAHASVRRDLVGPFSLCNFRNPTRRIMVPPFSATKRPSFGRTTFFLHLWSTLWSNCCKTAQPLHTVIISSPRGPGSGPWRLRPRAAGRQRRGCVLHLLRGDPAPIQSGCACRGHAGLAHLGLAHLGCRVQSAQTLVERKDTR